MVTRTTKPAAAPAPGAGPADPLDALLVEAAPLDAAPPAPLAPGEAPPPTADEQSAANVHAILGALKLARNVAAPRFAWWAQFGQVWGDDVLQGQAQALEAFRLHMGWEVGELLDRFGPWITLGLAFGMPAYATWDALQQRRELIEAERRRSNEPPAPPPTGARPRPADDGWFGPRHADGSPDRGAA